MGLPSTQLRVSPAIPSLANSRQSCGGKGRCLSLRDAGPYVNFKTTLDYTSYSGWDADMIHGCICDEGWEGLDCNMRSCPHGDDPITPGVNEVQLIDCQCRFPCAGGLHLTFEGQQTQLIPYDAEEELIKFRILQVEFCSLTRLNVTSPCILTDIIITPI